MLRVSAFVLLCAFAVAAVSPPMPASAQQPAAPAVAPPPQPPYGSPLTLEQAKRVMAAAELEATKNSWSVAITILDSGGNMVMFHKGDNTQLSGYKFASDGTRLCMLPLVGLADPPSNSRGNGNGNPSGNGNGNGGRGEDRIRGADSRPGGGGPGGGGGEGEFPRRRPADRFREFTPSDDQIAKAGTDVLAKGM